MITVLKPISALPSYFFAGDLQELYAANIGKIVFLGAFGGILGIFTTWRGISPKTVIFSEFPGPSQEQLGESRPRYLTNSQPRPPIIMIIIDATHLHLSTIIIIIGGRGCELVKYRVRDSPSCYWLGAGLENHCFS